MESRISVALAGVCLTVILVQGILLLSTFSGDPNLYLVYARNIAHGDPFSFNPGEFSSGSTGPLWAVVLAIPFVFSDEVLAAKLLGLAFTMLAFWLTNRSCLKVSGSPAGSVLAAGIVVWTGGYYGLMIYESSMLQCLLALAIWLTADALGNPPRPWQWTGLALVWAAVPLTRPDAAVLVVANVAVLFLAGYREKSVLRRLILVALIAALPGILYFGYSYIVSGYFSVSATSRGFALKQGASSLAGMPYSLGALRKLLAWPLVILVGSALWAWETRGTTRSTRYLLGWCAGAVLAYAIVSTVVVPASLNPLRYLLAALPFLAAMASLGLRDLLAAAARRRFRLFVLGLVGGLLVVPAVGALRFAAEQRARGHHFEAVMEKPAADWLNLAAPPGAQVLTHEVQVRYFLRPDLRVLSLDGITDGKVVPYLASGDMRAFLLRHRPDYWVANDAVHYRAYLASGLLRRVVEAVGDREGASTTLDGIGFTNVRINRDEGIPGFAAHRQIISLTYAASP